MHNEGEPLNVMPILVAAPIECGKFGNSRRYVETNLHLRCAYHPRSNIMMKNGGNPTELHSAYVNKPLLAISFLFI